jgi:hypothetical protein
MNARLLALALALAIPLFAGCNPASKLHGKWDLETEDPEPPAMGGAYIPSAVTGFMKYKKHLEFLPNGTCKVEARAAGDSEAARGKWRYVKTDGDALVLMVQMEGDEEREVRVRFVDRKTIETVPLPASEDESWTEQTATFTRRPF